MKIKKIAFFTTLIILTGILIYILYVGESVFTRSHQDSSQINILPQSPLDASYLVDGVEMKFEEGKSEAEIGEDTVVAEVLQEPVYGDMNSDEREDTALLMTFTKNESPKTYFVALALKDDEGFLGVNAVPLHDGLVPQAINIQDEVLVVTYNDTTSMVETDTDTSQVQNIYEYFSVVGVTLQRVGPLDEKDEILKGLFIYTNETQTFTSCASRVVYQLSPESHARAALEAVYLERTRYGETNPDGVYAVLAGHSTEGVDTSVTNEEEPAEDTEEEDVVSEESVETEVVSETLPTGNVFIVSTVLSAPQNGECSVEEIGEEKEKQD